MQVLPVEGFEKRVVYNASKAYVMQLRGGDDYPKLCDVVGVTICNFKLWPTKIKDHGYKVPMLSRWRMQEQKSGHKGLKQVQYIFVDGHTNPQIYAPLVVAVRRAQAARGFAWTMRGRQRVQVWIVTLIHRVPPVPTPG